tara:strand:+ start:269 stop:886 length:618 start_codon:yes stop_codon:yes gene_type:complete
MHKLKILVFGPESFISTLTELKLYFNFNLTSIKNDIIQNNVDVLICHKDKLEDKEAMNLIKKHNCLKILASNKDIKNLKTFNFILKLPTSIKEINNLVESSIAKEKFVKNSSIYVKSYSIDKNEKKLFKDDNFIVLTEKEIQLLELFLSTKEPIPKEKILLQVWKYSSDADTHTVETHIYRLRKKINDSFGDNNFILNNKQGYYI